jgi:hypothetical protein
MAEDRKDSKHDTDRTITGPPLKQPLASHPPQSTDFAETAKLPGYVAWFQLQYQQQLETAIANVSGGPISRLAYPQANTQSPPQFLSSTATPTGLENPCVQASLNSPFANQQWLDNRAPQVVCPQSPDIRSGQNMQYSAELPAMANYDASSPNMDYLMRLAQQSMVNAAAGGGQDRQTTVDHAVGQAQFGGEQQLQHLLSQCASVLCLAWLCPLLQVCSHCCITVTAAHCHGLVVQQTSTVKQQQRVDSLLESPHCFRHCIAQIGEKRRKKSRHSVMYIHMLR